MTAIILDLLWVSILLTHVFVQVTDVLCLDILQKNVLLLAEFQEVLYLLGYCLFLIDLIPYISLLSAQLGIVQSPLYPSQCGCTLSRALRAATRAWAASMTLLTMSLAS